MAHTTEAVVVSGEVDSSRVVMVEDQGRTFEDCRVRVCMVVAWVGTVVGLADDQQR
jgi:hypothetical protein